MQLPSENAVIEDCDIGEGTIVRPFVNMFGCKIGKRCKVAAFVEIQRGVVIGDDCKIEPFVFIPSGVTAGDRVFLGPNVTFTNDRVPKAVGGWKMTPTVVEDDASIGAGAVIVCGVTIGKGALVGAGAVVTKDVPPGATVVGNPARPIKRSN